MAVPFLTQASAALRIAVEVAWGADLSDLTGASWTWSDITADVLISGGEDFGRNISITLGRADESSQTQASEFRCVLDNRSGAYSLGGQASNWPDVKRGTPVRCRVSTNSGSTWKVKYQGNAVSWQPGWDEAGKFATVTLTASDALRQIDQGTRTVTSAFTTWFRENMASSPDTVGWWPLEEGSYASRVKSGMGGPDVTITGNGGPKNPGVANLGGEIFACTGPMAGGGNFGATLPSYTATGTSQLTWLQYAGSNFDADGRVIAILTTSSGSVRKWLLSSLSGAYLRISGYDDPGWSGGTPLGTKVFETAGYKSDIGPIGAPLLMTLIRNNSDNHVVWAMRNLAGQESVFEFDSGLSSGTVTSCNVLIPGEQMQVGQMWFRTHRDALSIYDTALRAYAGETITTRLTRLATAANIPLTIKTATPGETSTSPADSCGPQYWDTLTSLLRECEATGQGLLFGGLGLGLTYVTRQARESQQPTLTLDAAAGGLAPVFEPIDDDQRIINNVTVQRRSGSSAVYQDISGALGIDAVGDYQSSLTVNPSTDAILDRYAQWAVHLGTLGGYRYPTISFALEWQPSKIADWLDMIPSGRLDVTNIQAIRSQHPAGTLRNVVEGWTEIIDTFTWRVTCNCTNWQGWNVGTMAAATGTTVDTVMRRDTDGSAVNTAASAGATSLSVKRTSGSYPLWTTAADDFPMLVDVAGVPVTVTAISGGSSPQTFTLAGPGLPKAAAVNDPVKLWNPPVLGL